MLLGAVTDSVGDDRPVHGCYVTYTISVVFFVGAYSVYGEMGRGRIRTAKRKNSHWWGVAVPETFSGQFTFKIKSLARFASF